MYAPPEAVRAYLEDNPPKPFILCEYMHNMGNSLGGMESYIRLEEEFSQYQGGFIWDYMDQALWRTDHNGRRVLGYGGDFGERQSDYAFSGNGIVFADGTEKPAMQEVRYWYSSAEERAAHDAANLRAEAAAAPLPVKKAAALRVSHGDGALGVRGRDFEVLFSYPEGGPVSLVSSGREWLWRAPRPAYWRAPTENDLGNGFAVGSSIWSAVDAWQKCEAVQVLQESETEVGIRYAYTAPAMPGLWTEVTYTVTGSGNEGGSALSWAARAAPAAPVRLAVFYASSGGDGALAGVVQRDVPGSEEGRSFWVAPGSTLCSGLSDPTGVRLPCGYASSLTGDNGRCNADDRKDGFSLHVFCYPLHTPAAGAGCSP